MIGNKMYKNFNYRYLFLDSYIVNLIFMEIN